MNVQIFVCLSLFLCSCILGGVKSSDINELGSHFYEELGCTKKETGKVIEYDCPDFSLKNGTCQFRDQLLKDGDSVDEKFLKGSCTPSCTCTSRFAEFGGISCAHADCFQRLKSGCSHFKYSLDGCCPVDSVCGPIAKCEIEGTTHQEGQKVYLKKSCDVCVCDVNFEQKAPFCRRRLCYDHTIYASKITKYGAPVFFKDEKCCPDTWTTDEGEEIVKIDSQAPTDSGLSCKFGDRTVPLGNGFRKVIHPYGSDISLKCECSVPPFVICLEEQPLKKSQ